MKVRITPLAAEDLASITDWISRDSPRLAASFRRELRAKCADLASTSDHYPLAPEAGEQVRKRVHRPFLIFYRVEQDTVVIVRILHGARNYPELLDD